MREHEEDYGPGPEHFDCDGPWTLDDCADDFTAEQRLIEARVRVIHAENDKCAVCKQRIDTPENATHNRLTDGTEFLAHKHYPDCQSGAIEIMIGRYLTKRERKFVA